MTTDAQHHPAGDYDISLNDSVGDKFMFAVVDDSTVFTHHLSMLSKLLTQTSHHLDF